MKELMKLIQKKKKTPMSPEYKEAKMGVLEALKNEMGNMIGEDLKGMKKVTVASSDEEGLKKGLDKAKEMMGDHEGMMHEKEEEEESSEDDMMSPEEIDAKIEELKAMKMKKMME